MAKNSIQLVFGCLLFATLANTENVPVLLFGKSLPFKVPALQSLQTEEFSNLIRSQIDQDTVTVIFVEPKLNIEDLTQCKTTNGVTCFKQLSSISDKSYLPNVNDAVTGLYDNLDESEKVTVDTSEDIFSTIEAGNRIVFVDLDLAMNSDDYMSHDKIIAEIFSKLSEKYKNIVAIYTGRTSKNDDLTIIRKKRDTNARNTGKGAINQQPITCKNFIIAAENIVIMAESGSEEVHTITSCSTEKKDGLITVTILPIGLNLIFKNFASTWALVAGSMAQNPLKVPIDIYANEGYAYRCGGNITLRETSKSHIKIRNVQLMASFKQDEPKFNLKKIVYCEGFWSAGIVSGLFVVFILLIILLYGISWLMAINTMDKFDDPKGKTITINTTD